jgi:hypothetical protein
MILGSKSRLVINLTTNYKPIIQTNVRVSMSHKSIGLQGLYQGQIYFFSFFYAVSIGCNLQYLCRFVSWFVLLCFVCLLLVVLLCVIWVFVYVTCVFVYVTCVFVYWLVYLCTWLVYLCFTVLLIMPPRKPDLHLEINLRIISHIYHRFCELVLYWCGNSSLFQMELTSFWTTHQYFI